MNQVSLSPFANFNSAVPWGLWVAIYIWLVGISAGSFLLVCWGNLRNSLNLKKVTRLGISLSLATLLVGLLSIQIDLGHIERFYKLFTSPSPNSVMAWMVWLYGAYAVILLWSLFKFKKEIPFSFSILASLLALLVMVLEGLLFARPPGKHWHSLIFLIHFFTSSLVGAIAALIFTAGVYWPKNEKAQLLKGLSRIALPLIIINLLVEIMEIAFLGSLNHLGTWLMLLGNVIAISLLLRHSLLAITLAGGIELIDVLLSKYNSLISAQIVEPFRGFGNAYIEPRAIFSYAPSSFEWLVAVFLVCLTSVLFYILYRVLPLITEEM